MRVKSCLTCGIVCSGLTTVMAAIGAGQGALAGWSGAKMLALAGLEGYAPTEAAQMGALGGALLSATVTSGLAIYTVYRLLTNAITVEQLKMSKKKPGSLYRRFCESKFFCRHHGSWFYAWRRS